MQRTVVLVEDNFQGHRWMYVSLLMRWARDHDITLHLVTSADVTARESMIADLGAILHAVPNPVSVELAADVARRVGADVVLMPDGDHWALQQGLRRTWPADAGRLRTLVMREHAQRKFKGAAGTALLRISDIARTALFRHAARSGIDVVFLCSGSTPAPKPNQAPDPVEFEPDAQSPVELSHEVAWVGLIGAIDMRKNPLLLIDAASRVRTPGGEPAVGVVIAGRLAPDARPALSTLPDDVPVVVLDKMLTDGELDALVRDVSITSQLHDNDGPSGIMAKSLRAGTRVLAGGSAVLRQDCQRVGAGALWVPLEVDAVAQGIRELLGGPDPTPLPLGHDAFCSRLLAS